MRKIYLTRGIFTALVLLLSISTFAQERVAHYTFSGNANDETTNANDGQVFGATLVEDRFGAANSAYEFDGVDDYILVPQSMSLNTSDYVTVSFWLTVPEFVVTGEYYLISQGSWNGRWKASLPSHGKTVWTTKVADGDISDMDSDPEVLPLDTWTHVVMVHDGTNNDIYFNGILAATKERAGTLASGNTDSLTIGRESTLWGNYFKGRFDDIRIYDIALSAAEILALYEDESTGIPNSIALDPVQVYPNPTYGFINIKNAENSQVSVYDIVGKLVLTYENKTSLGTINLSNYSGGIYFVKIIKDNATITRSISLIR